LETELGEGDEGIRRLVQRIQRPWPLNPLATPVEERKFTGLGPYGAHQTRRGIFGIQVFSEEDPSSATSLLRKRKKEEMRNIKPDAGNRHQEHNSNALLSSVVCQCTGYDRYSVK